jgi:deoxyribose-phosphate aldolase
MDRDAVAAAIDHTVLGPKTTLADVEAVLDTAVEDGMNACIPPCYIDEATAYAPDVTLVTVVGFPHGQHASQAKEHEAERAWDDGADELDVVANVGRLHAGDGDAVRSELEHIVAATPLPVKVIVEAGLLSDAELRRVGKLAKEAGADYLKTSTGFAGGPARVEDVETLSEFLPVKASGGIGDWEAAKAMFDAGAERIGASAGDEILASFDAARE